MSDAEQTVLFRQQIPRWIVASISKICDDAIKRFNTGKIVFLHEQDVTSDAVRKNKEMIVIDFDGPDLQKHNNKNQRYIINYTLVVTTHRDINDMYAHQRTHGVALECFPPCIPVYRYGDGPLDNAAQMGTLTLVADPTVFGHGTPGSDTPVYQSSVSAQYRMDYSED